MSDDPIGELEVLLREEREAIRRLDGSAVLSFARRKQELMAAVRSRGSPLDGVTAVRLRALVPTLRQNGVLLAHARDIIRDALAAVGAGPHAHKGGAQRCAPRRILSVRG